MFPLILDGLSYFSSTFVVLIIVILGWFFCDKSIFFHAVCLSCSSILINVALKGTFKVPLPPELHPGYAFPSGHMQFATVFYGWLFYHYNNRVVRSAIVGLLICLGAHMLRHHYHTLIELLAGFVTGMLLIQLYIAALHRFTSKTTILSLLVACFTMIYNYAIYTHIPVHTWHAFVLFFVLIFVQGLFLTVQQNEESEISADKGRHPGK